MNLHLNILDEKRQAILPLFKDFSKDGFYLAGGTGLALLLGHRDSIDFDFFKEGDFDTDILIENISKIFTSHKLTVTQKEINTVSVLIDENIQISFFGYHHSLLMPLIKADHFDIASIIDIGCMKLSAITSRYTEKDYVDLYFILQSVTLTELLENFIKKYPNFDKTVILKSLVYFDDLIEEPILFKENHDVSLETIKEFLQKTVKDYLK
ncbi:MAG: nucleotidyl transferase AbiEii/AbiGii toxin family protein [Candidatus Taylorbacteria bacterium]